MQPSDSSRRVELGPPGGSRVAVGQQVSASRSRLLVSGVVESQQAPATRSWSMASTGGRPLVSQQVSRERRLRDDVSRLSPERTYSEYTQQGSVGRHARVLRESTATKEGLPACVLMSDCGQGTVQVSVDGRVQLGWSSGEAYPPGGSPGSLSGKGRGCKWRLS